MTTINTLNSTYEIDFQNQRIRRVQGINPPTDHFDPDGEWKDYEEIFAFNDRLVVAWPDGTSSVSTLIERTWTPL